MPDDERAQLRDVRVVQPDRAQRLPEVGEGPLDLDGEVVARGVSVGVRVVLAGDEDEFAGDAGDVAVAEPGGVVELGGVGDLDGHGGLLQGSAPVQQELISRYYMSRYSFATVLHRALTHINPDR
nr:hypothetical protein [Glycomyces buryatensis]